MPEPAAREIAIGPDVVLHLDAFGRFASIAIRAPDPRRSGMVRVKGTGNPLVAVHLAPRPIVYWEDAEGRVAAVQVL